MGYGTPQRHEGVKRATILPAFTQTLAEVHFHPHADFASIQVFTCDRLSCVLTKEACAANYTRANAPLSCKGCKIGVAHAAGDTPTMDRHALSAIANSQSCIRCERDGRTATRYIGRFRLVRDFTLCINCFNRQREVERGANAKGAKPVKWAHLQQATITIEDAAGDWKTLDIGLRSSRAECERYVARIHPGSVIVECFMSGTAMPPAEKVLTFNAIAREAGVNPATARSRAKKNNGSIETPAPRKPRPAPRTDTIAYAARQAGVSPQTASYRLKKYGSVESPKKAPAGDAPAVSPAWSQVFGDPIEAPKQRRPRPQPLPAFSREEDAAYRQSFEETVSDYGFSSDLAEFIEWIAKDWPAFDSKAVDASVPDTAPVAKVDFADPVNEHIEPVARGVQHLDAPAEAAQDIESGEWEGCYLETDGENVFVTDYAREHGLSDWDAAEELGMCEPEEVEPEDVAPPAPAPIAQPAFERTRKLTKAEKKALKKVERAERLAQAQPKPNGLAPTMLANTCKAFVHVMFELAAER